MIATVGYRLFIMVKYSPAWKSTTSKIKMILSFACPDDKLVLAMARHCDYKYRVSQPTVYLSTNASTVEWSILLGDVLESLLEGSSLSMVYVVRRRSYTQYTKSTQCRGSRFCATRNYMADDECIESLFVNIDPIAWITKSIATDASKWFCFCWPMVEKFLSSTGCINTRNHWYWDINTLLSWMNKQQTTTTMDEMVVEMYSDPDVLLDTLERLSRAEAKLQAIREMAMEGVLMVEEIHAAQWRALWQAPWAPRALHQCRRPWSCPHQLETILSISSSMEYLPRSAFTVRILV